MSKPPLPPEAVELLRRPHPAVMATLRSDGTPVSTPTWYVWADGRVLISLDEDRIRLKYIRREQRLHQRLLLIRQVRRIPAPNTAHGELNEPLSNGTRQISNTV